MFADVVDRADMGMVQRRGGLGFPLESLQGLRISGNVFGQELQRHVSAEPGVFSLIDHAHPTAAEFVLNSVM